MQHDQKSLKVSLTTKVLSMPMLLLATCLCIPMALADEAKSDGRGEKLIELKGHTGRIPHFSFSPDSQFVATASFDESARLWDVKTGKAIRTFTGINSAVICAVFSPDGKRLATSGGFTDPSIHVWDIADGAELTVLRGHTSGVGALAFSADGKRMVSGSVNNVVKVWDLELGKEIWTMNEHTDEVCTVAFSPDGKYIASGSRDHSAYLWDSRTGKNVRKFTGHTYWINVLQFVRSGSHLALASGDGKISIWNLETADGKPSFLDHGDHAVFGFCEDCKGAFRSIDGAGIVKLWSDRQCIEAIPTWRYGVDHTDAVAFTEDGKIVGWSETDSKSVILWNIAP